MKARTRILLVTDNPPTPPTSGGAQRTTLIARALGELGQVDLLLVDRFRLRDPQRLRRLSEEYGAVEVVAPWSAHPDAILGGLRFVLAAYADLLAAPLGRLERAYAPEPRVAKLLSELLAERRYDLIVGRYLRATAFSGALRHAPVVLDMDDHDLGIYESVLAAPAASRWDRFCARRALAQLRPLLPHLLARCAHVWVTSEEDRARVGAAPATVLPNIPFPDDVPAAHAQAPSGPILWVGTLDYHVNARAVERFLSAVWPLIFEQAPSTRFRIVGAGLSPRQRRSWANVPGVEPVGYVADLPAEYARARFAIAPIFEGAGTKIKVLEAMRHGRAVVATAHAQRGFAHVLRDGESLLVAADEPAFAAACLRLIRDPELAARLGQAGRQVVAREFGFDRFRQQVHATVANVLDAPPKGARPPAREALL